MTAPRFTLGMATYDDAKGVWATVQALRHNNPSLIERSEILIVDNNPESKHGEHNRSLVRWAQSSCRIRYVALPEPKGTAAPRNKVFEEAHGEYVICMDCHVLFTPTSLYAIASYFQEHPYSMDLVTGPMMYDDLATVNTHFRDQWRAHMWGVWDTNQAALQEGKPFEIPAQGLGLFACRWDAWLGFNPHFRGFGGEEWYIHEKFRKAGRKCICLPRATWNHCYFQDKTYPNTEFLKCRNYILGHQELGRDLKPVYDHFVSLEAPEGLKQHLALVHGLDGKLLEGRSEEQLQRMHRALKISEEDWRLLVADPVHTLSPSRDQRSPQVRQEMTNPSLDALFLMMQSRQGSTAAAHAAVIRDYASRSQSVFAITQRQDWEIALVAGRPQNVVTHQFDVQTSYYDLLDAAVRKEETPRDGDRILPRFYTRHHHVALPQSPITLEDCDLFVLDLSDGGTIPVNFAELKRVKRWIMLHGTAGSGKSIPKSLLRVDPNLRVTYHDPEMGGLTILSRDAGEPIVSKDALRSLGISYGGPGTELKGILAGVGIEPGAACDCHQNALDMDFLGVEGCRRERDKYAKIVKDNAQRWGWGSLTFIAAKAVFSGLAFRLNPLDPYGSLVDEAIRLAAEKEAAQ